MAYCIYLRKSRADRELELQGFGETLKRHRDTLIELAKKKNLPIGEIYEEVVSGDSIAARPQMQRLLNDVSDGKWEGVLVMEIERLARGDTSDQGIVTKTFTYSNTLIITPMKTFNPTDEFDQEYFEFGPQEQICLTKCEAQARLLKIKDQNFFALLKEKLAEWSTK